MRRQHDEPTSNLDNENALNWKNEIKSFIDMCGDDNELKSYWYAFYNDISELPSGSNYCGMIQNDPHMENILIHDDELYLIDFDVSNYHFFASDIAVAIQSVLFTLSGGMERPVKNKEALLRFVSYMLKGYYKECEMPNDALNTIDLFISYRRLLLFTVMQDWLKTKPDMLNSWKKMVIEKPPVFELIRKRM